MKKIYSKPEIEIIAFDILLDVIEASSGDTVDVTEGNFGPSPWGGE